MVHTWYTSWRAVSRCTNNSGDQACPVQGKKLGHPKLAKLRRHVSWYSKVPEFQLFSMKLWATWNPETWGMSSDKFIENSLIYFFHVLRNWCGPLKPRPESAATTMKLKHQSTIRIRENYNVLEGSQHSKGQSNWLELNSDNLRKWLRGQTIHAVSFSYPIKKA